MGAITGFTGRPDPQLDQGMAAALSHRGGDRLESCCHRNATLTLRLPRGGRCVGCVAPGAHEFPEQDLTIALCGWVTRIDDRELAGSAAGDGSDSSSLFYRDLARRFREEGLSVAGRLHGAFILVVRDGSTIHITRDGAGNRTAYYAWHAGRWLFGAEPKAITSAPGFSKRIRPAAIAQYLACSFVPGSGTMLQGVYELQAGHTVSLTPGMEPRITRWFRFEENEVDEAPGASGGGGPPKESFRTDERCVRLFREEIERAVSDRIPRGEPVGVFLSGGLDSSIVTAELARQLGGRNVRTWAIHFGSRYSNELEFARAVAQRCGTRHEEVCIQPKGFLPRLRRMIWHLDDPIGDPITQPNFELAAHVSREVRFVFNGEGGDPCFGGPKNIPMMLHHWYGGLDRQPDFRERHYLRSYRRAWDEIDLLLSDEVRCQIDAQRDLDGVFAPYLQARHPRLFLNRLTAVNIREKGAHLIQPKVERMLGAHGLTPLAPLFDERLIELSFRLPARLKLHRGIEKVILKRAYEKELPAEVINRPKSGMRVPVHFWFRGELRRYARRILSPREVRRVGLFDAERVRKLLEYDIEEGRGRYGLKLWMLITLELWRRIIVEGEPV